MGQFSWLDCVTKAQIVDDKKKKVYVLVPKEFGGGDIEEECYDGDGRFGGHDIYDLVADWNKSYIPEVLKMAKDWTCDWIIKDASDFVRFINDMPIKTDKRTLGIALACYDRDNFRLRYPIKITYDKYAVYEECVPSYTDPNQGWAD